MMTTLRRQAASCIYGLAPFLHNILNGSLAKIVEAEVAEGYDTDDQMDFSFLDQVKGDIAALLTRAEHLAPEDPKVEAFIKVLQGKSKMPNNKSLVFSTFRHTLSYLVKNVTPTELRYGLIHGDVPDHERSSIRHRFSLPKEDTEALDVLISSEVGCEGLDFQFCDFLVNYDLPWNPMRVEQRIGRIDRYGQKSETVAIINLITPGTVDADIYERCLMRIGVFNNAIGGSEEILGNLSHQIQNIADQFELSPEERGERLQQLSDNEIRQVLEEQQLEDNEAELFGLNVPKTNWEKDLEEAVSFWLSPTAIQQCVATYLSERTAGGQGHLMGDKPLKTLRLSQEARTALLNDFKTLRKSADPASRQWEKWLKGGNATLQIAFDQQTASDHPDVAFLNVLHPLVRQSAQYLERRESVYVDLIASSDQIQEGKYPFALYRWKKLGVKNDEHLEPVVLNPDVDPLLLDLIRLAVDNPDSSHPSNLDLEQLDTRHHEKWRRAQATHIADNQALIEQRVQSLTVSHQARCSLLNDQITTATNDKIRLMKKSELARANADFTRRKDELALAAKSGDVHATLAVAGFISITKEAQR
jgi:hypothetical protein